MIGPGWMPSRPRPIGRRKLWSCHAGYPRRRRPRRTRPDRAAAVVYGAPALDHADHCGGVPAALPTARLRATTAAWHRVAAGDLLRWLDERWLWLKPRAVPILVAFAAMLAMLDAVKHLAIYARGDDVIQLPPAHYCAGYRDASSREHARPLLVIEAKGSSARQVDAPARHPVSAPRDRD